VAHLDVGAPLAIVVWDGHIQATTDAVALHSALGTGRC
jgi:hypothetical protein